MKRIIVKMVWLVGFVLCSLGFLRAEEKPSLLDEMRIIKQEGEVQETKDDKVIEKYYYKKEIIKEVPEEKGKYEKHLFDQLKTRLDKPKKKAEVWRVEGDLIELNRGAIHKVREGDVYKIYGKHGRYKGKMEVGAIADAVSIGRHLNKYHLVEESDIALYIGQRRFWGSGLLYFKSISNGNSFEEKRYEGYGLYWRLLFKHGWGVGISVASLKKEFYDKPFYFSSLPTSSAVSRYREMPGAWVDKYPVDVDMTYGGDFEFLLPFDIRKYFFHPSWYTCYVGTGLSFFKARYKFLVRSKISWNYIRSIDEFENKIIPIITAGTELSISKYLRIVLSGYYFHGPEINIDGYKEFTRPIIGSVAVVGTW